MSEIDDLLTVDDMLAGAKRRLHYKLENIKYAERAVSDAHNGLEQIKSQVAYWERMKSLETAHDA